MTGPRYTCPVHGLTEVHALADGVYCLADAPGNPDACCGKRCDFPMEDEDGHLYRTRAELIAGERTDPGPGKALPRRGRGIVVKQRPRQKAAKGPPARRAADPAPNTHHETTPRHAPEGAAPAKEEDVPETRTITCEQCEREFTWQNGDSRRRSAPKRCRECITKMPAAIWCGYKADHPGDLARCRELAAAYRPRGAKKAAQKPDIRRGAPIASVRPPPLVVEDDGEDTADGLPVSPQVPGPVAIPSRVRISYPTPVDPPGYDPDIEKVAPATPDVAPATPHVAPGPGLLARVQSLEEAVLELSGCLDALSKVILGEDS